MIRRVNSSLRKESGSIMDLLSVGIFILAMSVIMMAYLNNLHLMQQKAEISQLARKYILRMETTGYLTGSDRTGLLQELHGLGATQVDFSGSTLNEVGYGNAVILSIQGNISGKETITQQGLLKVVFGDAAYPFTELRMSTAKN